MPDYNIGDRVFYSFKNHFGDLVSRPAFIVNIFSKGAAPYMVNLVVFIDGSNDKPGSKDLMRWQTSVHYSEEPQEYHWHF